VQVAELKGLADDLTGTCANSRKVVAILIRQRRDMHLPHAGYN
jgi:hypothetical protein